LTAETPPQLTWAETRKPRWRAARAVLALIGPHLAFSSIAREDLSNPANLSWSFAVVDLLSALEERAFPDDARDAGKILEIEFHDCLIVGNSTAEWALHAAVDGDQRSL
jgi:hypothetical protein